MGPSPASEVLATADRLFVEEDYDAALQQYTEAIKADPTNARVLESRAHTHIKLENYLEAVEDANKAIELDPSFSKAYLRKGVACFNLEEYEAAKEAFEQGQRIAPENNQFKTWIRKCQAEIDEEMEDVQAKQPPTAASAPPTSTPCVAPPSPAPAPAPAPAAAQQPQPSTSAPSDANQPLAPAAPAVQEGKYRHQWYQLQNKVTVDVYAKNLAKEQVQVQFSEQHLAIIINHPSGSEEYRLETDLYGPVVAASCKYEVLKTKVEVTMVKASTLQWGSLEKSSKVAAPNYSVPSEPVAGKYPTSSRKNPKDWDKVESELSELEKKGELEFGDPLSNFFKKIFSQGDEDQRRAMMKSFQESNGTVLSTNWDEVGKKQVECTPPEGMEVKKWGKD